MDTNIKGCLAELRFLLKLTELGYSVSVPYGNKDRYDQIWDINGKLIKVQIKSCRWKDDRKTGITFNCYSVCNGRKHYYTKDEVDYFATFWEEKFYLVPIEECSSEKTLWFETSKHASGNCCKAVDYELEKMINV